MTVYVDNMKMKVQFFRWNGVWSNLYADTTDELVDFAELLHLSPACMIDGSYTTERYMLTDRKRDEAIRLGARPIRYGGTSMAAIFRRKLGSPNGEWRAKEL